MVFAGDRRVILGPELDVGDTLHGVLAQNLDNCSHCQVVLFHMLSGIFESAG